MIFTLSDISENEFVSLEAILPCVKLWERDSSEKCWCRLKSFALQSHFCSTQKELIYQRNPES